MSLLFSLAAFAGVFALAYANGANDISKGIATLVGSGITNYRRAIVWGTAWTVAGSLLAAFFSRAMVTTFSKGMIDPKFDISGPFLLAVMIGTIGWVFFATRTGLPVSTTHALTGALCGAAVVAYGWQGVQWLTVSQKVFIPLLLSPPFALATLWVLFPAIRFLLAPLNTACACAELRQAQLVAVGVLARTTLTDVTLPAVALVVDHLDNCQARDLTMIGIRLDDALHWISSGLTSFARGLNDTPKIVALGVPVALVFGYDSFVLFLLVALGIGLGSLVAGLRVSRTMAEKITEMNVVEGLGANLITSFFVTLASRWGIPLSTTHVSSGAIIGVGLRRPGRSVQWQTVRSMLQAWIITVPVAAGLTAASWLVLGGAR